MKHLTGLLMTAAIVGLAACSYRKEPIAYPVTTSNCDTSNVRYSQEIVKILAANCYVCHSQAMANAAGGGNILEGYDNLLPYASSKLLYNVVAHTNGFDQMPKNADKLGDCDIAKIRIWIDAGSPNN